MNLEARLKVALEFLEVNKRLRKERLDLKISLLRRNVKPFTGTKLKQGTLF